jgi:hypothetical protein
VQYLYDSRGRYIAVEQAGHLHSKSGRNVGHWLDRQGVFVDLKGRYLGELVAGNRLLVNKFSEHQFTTFGHFGNYGSVGRYEDPGRIGIMGLPSGYVDVDPGLIA